MNFSDGVNRVYLVITPDGRVEPGPDLSPDEATRAVVRQLGAQFSWRIAELEREVERLREIARAVITFDDKETWIGDGRGYLAADVGALMDQARALLGLDA